MTRTGIVIPTSSGLSVVTDPPLKFQWSPQKTLSAPPGHSNDWSLMSNTTEVIIYLELRTIGVKSVKTLGSKIRFSSMLDIFSSLPPEIMLIFQIPRLHKPQHLRNIELRGRGIRYLTLDANKLEQILRESSFNMTRGEMKILKIEAWNFSSPPR